MKKVIKTMSGSSFAPRVNAIKNEIKKGRECICEFQCTDVRSAVNRALELLNVLQDCKDLSENERNVCSGLFLDIHNLLDDMHTFVKLVELDNISFEKCKPLIPEWMLESAIRFNAMQLARG